MPLSYQKILQKSSIYFWNLSGNSAKDIQNCVITSTLPDKKILNRFVRQSAQNDTGEAWKFFGLKPSEWRAIYNIFRICCINFLFLKFISKFTNNPTTALILFMLLIFKEYWLKFSGSLPANNHPLFC